MVKEIKSKAEFDSEVSSAGATLLAVDFTAKWCGPCKFIGPEFAKMADEFKDVIFVKVDVDDNAETAEACEIRCMPTFLFYKNGQKVATFSGADVNKLRSVIQEHK